MLWFIVKTLLSGVIIAFASWLAGKNPTLAGFLIALPMMSMLAIIFSWMEFRDMQKIDEFAVSILVAVPLSLVFFLPFVANRWFKMGFPLTYFLAVAGLSMAYGLHNFISRKIGG